MTYQDALDTIGEISNAKNTSDAQNAKLQDVEDYVMGMHLLGKPFDYTALHHYIDHAKSNKLGGVAIYENRVLDHLKQKLSEKFKK